MGVETKAAVNVGRFTEGQRNFLDCHRKRGAAASGTPAYALDSGVRLSFDHCQSARSRVRRLTVCRSANTRQW